MAFLMARRSTREEFVSTAEAISSIPGSRAEAASMRGPESDREHREQRSYVVYPDGETVICLGRRRLISKSLGA